MTTADVSASLAGAEDAGRLVLPVLDSAMIPSLVSADRTRLQATPVSVLSESF